MSSTELQASAIVMGSLQPPRGRRKLLGGRGAEEDRSAGQSPRFGPIQGLESQIMGQTLGPKRVVASGAPWPLIVAASAVLVLAAFTVR